MSFIKKSRSFWILAIFLCSLFSTIPIAQAALSDNLVGFWNLNEASGSRTDSAGSSTLTESGGTVSSATGKINNAAAFPGTANLSIADNAALSAGDVDLTMSGWVYLTSNSTSQGLMGKWGDAGVPNREYVVIYYAALDRFTLFVSSNGSGATLLSADNFGSPALNTWYYITVWHDSVGNTINISVNNGLTNSASYSSGLFDGPDPFTIGQFGGGNFTTARIDGVGVWKRVLSAGERTQMYNSGTGIEYPGAPTSLTPTAGNAQVSLSWTAPSSNGGSAITDYKVEYKRSIDPTWTTFSDGVSTGTTATVTGLTNSTAYNFRVSSTNVLGTGTPSSTATETPSPTTTAPGAPTGVITTAGNTQVGLSWTAPVSDGGSAITDYIVEYKLASEPTTWTTFSDGTSTTPSTTVTGLSNGSLYDFRIKAVNAIGTGTASSTASTTPAVVPGAPTSLTPTAGDTQVALSWSAPVSNGGTAITDYIIQYKLSSEPTTWTTFSDGTSATASATVTGLINNSAYDFRVAAVNAIGTGSVSSTVSATPVLPSGSILITNSNLVWSPYNWRFNGSTYAQTSPGGGYVKIAFTGTTLGIAVDTSTLANVPASTVHIHAFIDGSTTKIDRTLANASSGVVNFTSSLSSGSHYAIIYLGNTDNDSAYDRWAVPNSVLRITSIRLASNGTILTPVGTPVAPKSTKAVIFGDSITEGSFNVVTGSEYGFAAIMLQALNTEYGQIGYGGQGWSRFGRGEIDFLYKTASPTDSSWRKYDATTSRLVDNNNLSSGFIDGAPDAVFVSMGVNDALNNTGAPLMRASVASWIADVRQASGLNTKIFIISPFSFGNTGNGTSVTYKAALLGGVTDYQAAHPSDTKIYTLDLGMSGYTTANTNSPDGLHPNDTGSAILGAQLAALADDYMVAPVISSTTSSSVTSTSATITWTTDEIASSQVSYGLTSSYGTTTTETDISPRVTSHSVSLTGLSPGTTYHYQVSSRDAGNTVGSSADFTFTTSTTVPGAPTSVTAVAGDSQAIVSFTPPASNGGASITLYTVTSTPGSITATGSSSPITITGLTNGMSYTFSVTATNNVGIGSASSSSSAVTPVATVVPVVVTPSSNGGRPPSGVSAPVQTSNNTSNPIVNVPTNTFSPLRILTSSSVSLRPGVSNTNVKTLQQYLNAHGYIVASIGAGSPGKETSYFGSATKKALMRFQKANGLVADGILGPKTKAKIN